MTPATEQKRALFIGAHPDDSEFAAGGTVAKLAAQGWDVTFIVVTNGNKGTQDQTVSPYMLSETREHEQRSAAEVLGVQRVIFLRNNDGELEPSPALRAEFALYIRYFKPHAVFTHDPWKPYMLHPDHRIVGFAVIDAIVSARDHLFMPGLGQIGITVWRPETLYLWTTDHADYIEDITDYVEQKITAIKQHASQVAHNSGWEERVRQRLADAGKAHNLTAAEAFKCMVV